MPGYVDAEGIILGWTEKAACTSITRSLMAHKRRRYSAEECLRSDIPSYLVLRHPIERFQSIFAYFYGRWTEQHGIPRDSTLEKFTDHVLRGAEDPHWLPQVQQHSLNGQLVTDYVCRLPDLEKIWPKNIQLRRENVGRIEKSPITYRLDEIEEYYRADLDAWANAE